MPITQDQIDELLALAATGERIQVCEYLHVVWDTGVENFYAGSAHHENAPFTGIGETIEPRIIHKNKNDPFHEIELNPDLRTDSITVTFEDIDKEITGLFQTYGSGVQCSFNLYYPQPTGTATVEIWSGQLQAPSVFGWKTLKTVATNGFRSRESLTPSRSKLFGCTAHVFGGLLPDADSVASSLCPYDRHVAGSVGLFITGSTPFSDCPKDLAACNARFGHGRFFGGFTVDRSATVANPQQHYIAVSKGNASALTEPIRVVFGTKIVRSLPAYVFRAEINTNTADRGFISAVWEVAEGPVSDIYNFKVKDKVIEFMHINHRLGTRGQAATAYSSSVSNYPSTAHTFARYGWTNAEGTQADDYPAECTVKGFSAVCVYTDDSPVTKTRIWSDDRVWCLLELFKNQKFGLGYAESKFNILDWMTASTWGRITVTHTVEFPDGETQVYTSMRTTMNAILEGRPVSEQVEDICRAGGLSVPFQHEGDFTLTPFRKATTDELTEARVFYDRTSGVNILWENEPKIELSVVPDNKLVNEVEVRFEEASNQDTERPITVDDPDQKLLAGRQLGPDYFLSVPKKFSGFGISSLAEAIRFAYRMLWFGEFDEGGTKNNLRATFTVPFEQALGLQRYEIIKLVTDLLDGHESPEADQFEYFRILNLKKVANGRCEITAQAYNHVAYAAFETELGGPPDGTDAAMLVQGAGTTFINGVYSYRETLNDRPAYQKGPFSIWWDGSQWNLGTLEEYFSTDDVATPDLATWDVGGTGQSPAPVVSVSLQYPALLPVEAVTIDPPTYDDATGQLTVTIN